MHVRVFILCLVTGLTMGAGGGCRSLDEETGRNTSPPVVLVLKPDERKTAAAVRIGDELKLVLPAERGPGYVWQIVTNDPRCLRQASGLVFTPGAGGTAGTTTVSFIAQRPSRSFVRFAYVPAGGAKETELVDGFQILVTVKN